MANKVEILINAKDNASDVLGGLGSLLPGLGKAFAAVGAAGTAAAAGIFAITKSTAESYDRIQKFSDQLGISTEFISKMAYASDLAGVKLETSNKAIQKLQIGIGEAGRGIGIAKDAFDALGISIRDQNNQLKTAETIMPELAEAFHNVANATQRAELASKIFGQRGVEMLQFFTNGKKGLEEVTKEAEKFGLVVSSKAAANAAAFNDSLTRVTGAFKGLKNYMAEQVMPIITGLANRFADFVANNRGAIIDFAEKAVSALGGFIEFGSYGVAALIDAWTGLKEIWQILKISFAELNTSITKGIVYIVEKVQSLLEALNFKGIFDDAIEGVKRFADSQNVVIEDMEKMADKAWGTLNSLANDGLAVEKVADFSAKVKETIAELKAEGNVGELLAVSDKTKEQSIDNIGQMTAAQKAAYEQLLAAHDEYYLSEEDRLAEWYEVQQEMFAGNKEALALIEDVYRAKSEELEIASRQRISDFDKKKKIAEDKTDKEKIKSEQKKADALYGIQETLGVKGFNLFKLMNIKETLATTHQAAMNAYNAVVGIPVIGPALAPPAYAAAFALGMGEVASIKGISLGGAAHGGLDYVPDEQTYLLQRGERVLSPNQNADLTDALNRGGIGGGNITIENMEFVFNVPTADQLIDMTADDWQEVVIERVLPAFRVLAMQGQTI